MRPGRRMGEWRTTGKKECVVLRSGSCEAGAASEGNDDRLEVAQGSDEGYGPRCDKGEREGGLGGRMIDVVTGESSKVMTNRTHKNPMPSIADFVATPDVISLYAKTRGEYLGSNARPDSICTWTGAAMDAC